MVVSASAFEDRIDISCTGGSCRKVGTLTWVRTVVWGNSIELETLKESFSGSSEAKLREQIDELDAEMYSKRMRAPTSVAAAAVTRRPCT